MKQFIIVHYGEIGLKKSNTDYFLKKLRKRLKMVLEKRFKRTFSIKHILRRFLIDLPEDFDRDQYIELLEKMFGIKNFKFVKVGSIDLNKLGEQIWRNLPKEEYKSFRVRVKRSMDLPYKSVEAERDLGAVMIDKGLDLPVKMKDAELEIDIEFFNDKAFLSFKKYTGPGGLSPNSQGKLISLISSGIDSPVASYMMMKRGARVVFAHFHSFPYSDTDEMEQVKDLVKILSEYQFDTKLYLIPFGKIQKVIATNLKIPGKVRTVIYRRIMLRIAEAISRKEKANGLVTGDSFGQVASQTPENMFAIHEVSHIPIFQPLIGFDKEDVVEYANKIGTFDISKLPCKDSCTMFMPRIPELRANVHDILEYEKDLPFDEWTATSLKDSEIIIF
ncbi:MAG: tRNA 4-thiouridine(8) synthase ThiI [bacterium]|nr:tRNA 4-thiouridine(8) synthase ThiI [bacterium]